MFDIKVINIFFDNILDYNSYMLYLVVCIRKGD